MKIVKGFPPNFAAIEKAFHPAKTFIFTYGDTIYFPMQGEGGRNLREDIIKHEEVHMNQQHGFFMTPEKWWKRYIEDEKFRFDQELEGYQAQWGFIARHANRKDKKILLDVIAKDLCSKNYGNLCTYDEAVAKIIS